MRFKPSDIRTAKEIILTPDDSSTEDRWEKETLWVHHELSELIESGLRYYSGIQHVVDFGCGIGRVTKALNDELTNTVFTGIDTSGEMRKLAREYIGEATNVTLSSWFHLVSDSSVDFIISIYSLQHVSKDDLLPALREFKRILKPTGRLYLLNLNGRCVPVHTQAEQTARTSHELNEAISSVTRNPNGAWENDGIDIPKILSSMFNKSEPVELPDKYFSKLTKDNHVSILYSGIKK